MNTNTTISIISDIIIEPYFETYIKDYFHKLQ